MATLIRMRFQECDGVREEICGVDEIHKGGEFTICGCAWTDSSIKEGEDFEAVDRVPFTGIVRQITCVSCLKTIGYYKKLK